MRKFGYAMAVILTSLATSETRSSPPPNGFAGELCYLKATDIVVATMDGRILECWRGGLKPGEMILLGADYQKPGETLPWLQSRPVLPINAWFTAQRIPELRAESICEARSLLTRAHPLNRPMEDERRLVLFLCKQEDPLSKKGIWLPVVPGNFGVWDFIVCTAWVENEQIVAKHAFGSHYPTVELSIAANLNELRAEVRACDHAYELFPQTEK